MDEEQTQAASRPLPSKMIKLSARTVMMLVSDTRVGKRRKNPSACLQKDTLVLKQGWGGGGEKAGVRSGRSRKSQVETSRRAEDSKGRECRQIVG
jgi:hypothetical protein